MQRFVQSVWYTVKGVWIGLHLITQKKLTPKKNNNPRAIVVLADYSSWLSCSCKINFYDTLVLVFRSGVNCDSTLFQPEKRKVCTQRQTWFLFLTGLCSAAGWANYFRNTQTHWPDPHKSAAAPHWTSVTAAVFVWQRLSRLRPTWCTHCTIIKLLMKILVWLKFSVELGHQKQSSLWGPAVRKNKINFLISPTLPGDVL